MTAPGLVRSTYIATVALSVCLWTLACDNEAYRTAAALTGGDPMRGASAIHRYGCDTCHTIPGVPTATALVGPPLERVASRAYLAGRLPNTPQNLLRFIRHPQQVDPGQVMPEMGVTERDARDIGAYLYTLR